ncbi:DUF4082 domain-containing protein [Verrucomicrobiota bacterium sgz303538]
MIAFSSIARGVNHCIIVFGILIASMAANAANPITIENALTGNPRTEWDVTGSGDASIQGFATDISVNKGGTIRFKVDTDARAYRIDIYRLGYYQGLGARKVATVTPSVTLPQIQPDPISDPATGLIDCGNWAVSASWSVPANATSGVYIAKLVRTDTGGASHMVFIVRDDTGGSDLLVQTSDTTWQAYNKYGGNSLYVGSPAGRAYKVSYNRPFITRAGETSYDWVFGAEYPMIRWLEANGYNVSYTTGVDTDRRGDVLKTHKVFITVGHDEYWSGGQRTNVEAARAAGVNLAFFAGNDIFWKTRWEPAIDGSGTSYRTLVCYKETHAGAKIDPTPTWTGTWRDPRFSPPSDGGRPENALTGTFFMVNGLRTDSMTVPAAFGVHRFWRNTSVATLAPNTVATFPAGTLGYEWNTAPQNSSQPVGLMRLSSTTVSNVPLLQDYGSKFASGQATHSLTLYRHSSGALVFSAGSVQWSWGLDSVHDNGSAAPDVRMRQATVNLFADMGTFAETLQSGLTPATKSSDISAPTTTIRTPSAGSSLASGTAVNITGTATDSGGRVWGVEVSVDGGATWQPASGLATWSFAWTPTTPGSVTIKSRAVDDSGNMESPSAGVTVTVTGQAFTSAWPSSTVPGVVDAGADSPVELGVKFRSDVAGSITGIRFYKAATNTGTHVGSLWTSSGTRLAAATFSGETASGWQQVNFSTPVSIAANTVYIASYHCPNGHYSEDLNYFATSGVDNGSLHLLANGVSGGNGVYSYGTAGTFPVSAFQASNYWVDVAFTAGSSGSPVSITTSSMPAGNQSSAYNATLDASGGTLPRTWSLASGSLPPGLTLGSSTGVISGTPTTQGTFSFTVKVTDSSTPVQTASKALSIAIGAPSPFVSAWPATTVPGVVDGGPDSPVELGVKFRVDVPGTIAGVRFYKGSANSGTHVGSLWSSTGTRLASATFTGETASGWQQVNFSTPVSVSANTVYIVSYHCPAGHYSEDQNYFLTSGVDNGPLHLLASGVSGANGVYTYGTAGSFPTSTFRASNYWVDVVFALNTSASVTSISVSPTDATVAAQGTQQFSATGTYSDGRSQDMSNQVTWSSSNTGVATISAGGLATAVGAGTTTITATYDRVSSQSTLAVQGAGTLSITTTSLPDGNVNNAYNATLAASGGTLPRTWSLTSGSLPPGLTLASSTGAISGTPTTAGTFSFTLQVSDSSVPMQTVSKTLSIAVSASALVITTTSLPDGNANVAYNATLAASGGTLPRTWALTSGSLPPGLTLASSTGGISGTPTTAGTFSFTVQVSDSSVPVQTASKALSIAVSASPLVITTSSLPDVTINTAYNATLAASGGTAPRSWSLTNGSLPPGLTLANSTGAISGTPTTAGIFSFTVQVSDSSVQVQTASKTLSISVNAVSAWPATTVPGTVDSGSSLPIELGVRFRVDVPGTITGIRFYKAAANTGTHVGSLWTSTGTRIASATFTGERASGWQQVNFTTPVTVAASTVYIASYHCPDGHYSKTQNGFKNKGVDNGPLHLLADGVSGANGIFTFGQAGSFPTSTSKSTNYWVDVAFVPSAGVAKAPPVAVRVPELAFLSSDAELVKQRPIGLRHSTANRLRSRIALLSAMQDRGQYIQILEMFRRNKWPQWRQIYRLPLRSGTYSEHWMLPADPFGIQTSYLCACAECTREALYE